MWKVTLRVCLLSNFAGPILSGQYVRQAILSGQCKWDNGSILASEFLRIHSLHSSKILSPLDFLFAFITIFSLTPPFKTFKTPRIKHTTKKLPKFISESGKVAGYRWLIHKNLWHFYV